MNIESGRVEHIGSFPGPTNRFLTVSESIAGAWTIERDSDLPRPPTEYGQPEQSAPTPKGQAKPVRIAGPVRGYRAVGHTPQPPPKEVEEYRDYDISIRALDLRRPGPSKRCCRAEDASYDHQRKVNVQANLEGCR
jgi:hypothetical protein